MTAGDVARSVLERAGREDGPGRDAQLAAVIELEDQPVGQDGQDSRFSHPALRPLQRDLVLRASSQVKTRGHDPSAGKWHTTAHSPRAHGQLAIVSTQL